MIRTARELFSRRRWRLLVSPQLVRCCVYDKLPKYWAHSRQHSIHVCLFGRYSCSSPSAKKLYGTDHQNAEKCMWRVYRIDPCSSLLSPISPQLYMSEFLNFSLLFQIESNGKYFAILVFVNFASVARLGCFSNTLSQTAT